MWKLFSMLDVQYCLFVISMLQGLLYHLWDAVLQGPSSLCAIFDFLFINSSNNKPSTHLMRHGCILQTLQTTDWISQIFQVTNDKKMRFLSIHELIFIIVLFGISCSYLQIYYCGILLFIKKKPWNQKLPKKKGYIKTRKCVKQLYTAYPLTKFQVIFFLKNNISLRDLFFGGQLRPGYWHKNGYHKEKYNGQNLKLLRRNVLQDLLNILVQNVHLPIVNYVHLSKAFCR